MLVSEYLFNFFMTIAYRCLSRRDVHLEALDLLGLDALDRLVLKDLQASSCCLEVLIV